MIFVPYRVSMMETFPVLNAWFEIAGLDPAGLYFERYDNKVKLDPSDASFVDVIHTDAASLFQMGKLTCNVF
jgi:hypothetical protein